MKKKVIYFLYIFLAIKAFCEPTAEDLNILNSNNANFSKVLSGQAVCEPTNLSFGIALINDARNFTCINDEGKILWEKKLRFSSDAKIYALKDDFIAVITKNNTIMSLYNSSGIQIFQTEFAQRINGPVIQGYDSRLFIPFENKLYCYSLGGIKKWELSIKNDGNIYTLNDNTIITNAGNLIYRISPFGEIIEEYNLAKQVSKIFQCCNGIIIKFSDSTISYFSTENNKIRECWKKSQDYIGVNSEIIFSQFSDFLVTYCFNKNTLSITYLLESDGSQKVYFEIPLETKISSFKFALNKNGLLIINSQNAEFYDNFGTIAWKKNLSDIETEKPIYIILKNTNDLIFFCSNWSINYFTIIKKITLTTDKSLAKKNFHSNDINEQNIISDSTLLFSGNFNNLSKQFLQGNYGDNEEYYINTIKDFYKTYTSTLNTSDFGIIDQPTEFESNISANIKLISLSFNLQTDEFSEYIIEIIRSEKNSAVLKAVLSGLSTFGYDADLNILKEIDLRAKKISPREENLIPFFCDATYSICKFMGKNAFEKYGNSIIKSFFSEQFSPEAKKISRDTYLKISKFFQYN